MKKIVFFILLAMLVCEASAYSIRFDMRDHITYEKIKEGSVSVTASYGDSKKTYTFLLDNSSEIRLDLGKPGIWNFEILVDQPGTPGNDYFVRHYTEIEDDFTIQRIFLFRVASIRGRVEDINKNLVSDALVRIECEENRFIRVSLNTDFFGTFEAENIPAGNCVAYASFQDAAGIEEFSVSNGEIKSIVVKLDRRVMSTKIMIRRLFTWGIIGVGALAAFIFALSRIKKSHKKPTEKDSLNNKEPNKNAGQDDRGHTLIEIDHSFDEDESNASIENEHKKVIPSKLKQVMETLKENEKQVVQYLISNNLEAKLSKIRFSLKIPKTTFFRIIKSLKNKKVITESDEKPRKAKINKDLL